MDMLPVWDFSLPEFDQLQAESEFMWNPAPDAVGAQVPTRAAARSGAPGPRMARPMASGNMAYGNGLQWPDGPYWERGFAAVPPGRAPAGPGAAPGPGRQDSLLPTPSPAENSSEDKDNNALDLQQRQGTGSSDSVERSKAVNRESQRRFRLRQKVQLCFLHPSAVLQKEPCTPQTGTHTSNYVLQARSQAVEAQLASTTAELKELKSRQHQLEVRNMLLEKVSQLNKNDGPQVSEVWSPCRYAPLSVRQQLPALHL